MARSPFGLWQVAPAGAKVPTGPLVDAGVADDAAVYKSMFDASQGRALPRDVDEMEIWEIAVLLGVSNEVESSEGAVPSHAKGNSNSRLKQRLAHSKGLAPKPEAASLDTDTLNQLTRALG